MILRYDFYDSPVGRLTLASTGSGLAAIAFPPEEGEPWQRQLPARLHAAEMEHDPSAVWSIRRWLDDYFGGKRVAPSDYEGALDPGGTPFQRQVWDLLKAIPYGRTASYGELAERLGQPGAMRAVGAANGRNPLPILVPCHRVIGSTGRLTGFGGGLWRKAALLRLEQGGGLFGQALG